MNLLLLLTALFASLTGAGSGERAMHVQGVAVVRAAEVTQTAVQRTQAVLPAMAAPARVIAIVPAWTPFAAASLPATHLPFERRLE